jgi:hypothetical protein
MAAVALARPYEETVISSVRRRRDDVVFLAEILEANGDTGLASLLRAAEEALTELLLRLGVTAQCCEDTK